MSTNEWRKKAKRIEWYDMKPVYSRQKSFYGKAEIEALDIYLDTPDEEQYHIVIWNLYSYKKNVARIVKVNDTWNPYCFGKYSHTTSIHQKEFFKQFGFDDEDLPYILNMSMTEEEINKL